MPCPTVAKANGSSDEKTFPNEAELRGDWSGQGFSIYPMAGAGAEELRFTYRGSRSIGGGNSGQYSSESPEGEEDRRSARLTGASAAGCKSRREGEG